MKAYQNPACRLEDVGDGILRFTFTHPEQLIGYELIHSLDQALARLEGAGGLLLCSHGPNFSLGAPLQSIAGHIEAKDWPELDRRVRFYQALNLKLRESPVPVVAAVRGYTVGGGCELAMHCHSVVAAESSRMGLAEVRAGLLPGTGGTKELTQRASSREELESFFRNLVAGRFSGSAAEAYSMGYLRADVDEQGCLDRARQKLMEARGEASRRGEARQTRPILMGMADFEAIIESLKLSHYDQHIARKIARVMSGGDRPGAAVSETELLHLEREAFMSLAGEPRTLHRIRHLLKVGLFG